MKKSVPINDLHKNHRERLRKKFDENSSILEDHEILEMLLFSIRPIINTNTIALRLINEFGSLEKVFLASRKELEKIEGVGEQTSTMIKLQYELLKRLMLNLSERNNLKLTPKNAGRYISEFFIGNIKESLIIFMLDKDCRVIKQVVVAKGTSNKVHADISSIVKMAVEFDAVYIIAAHNHPHGILEPSEADIQFTTDLEKALSFIEVRLVDHIIVSDEKYLSISNWLRM